MDDSGAAGSHVQRKILVSRDELLDALNISALNEDERIVSVYARFDDIEPEAWIVTHKMAVLELPDGTKVPHVAQDVIDIEWS